MITGELKSKIDAVWNDFWSGGIANPLEVMEQLTYLPFIKGLGERQTKHPTTDNRQRDAHSFRVARSDPDVRIRSSPHSTHLRSLLRERRAGQRWNCQSVGATARPSNSPSTSSA